MAGERTLPGIGLTGFWDEGSGYKAQMDENLLRLSFLTQPFLTASLAAAPGSPVNGEVYRATAAWSGVATAGQIVVRDNGAWAAYTPTEGWSFWDRTAKTWLLYDGSAWLPVNRMQMPAESTADFSLADSDFAGSVVRRASTAGAFTVTIPAGLTERQPCTIIQTGVGQVTFAPAVGVTVLSADSRLKLRTRYSSGTLIPAGSDTYYLVGDLAE